MQKTILTGHGAGGRLSNNLIHDVFLKHFNNKNLNMLNDSAVIKTSEYSAFTTDSYVVDPVFFPGGDIGKLAVSGTVNDLLSCGAVPEFLSAGFIIEEGFVISDLERIVESMAAEAAACNVKIVTGDTKVVKKGQCDKIFINTSGIGRGIPEISQLWKEPAFSVGDKIIVSGYLGDHFISILAARNGIDFKNPVLSDVAPLNNLLLPLYQKFSNQIVFVRDITRGGLATILNEVCPDEKSVIPMGITLDESKIPVRDEVLGICEMFGFEPLYLANEGKVVIVVKHSKSKEVLECLKKLPHGQNAEIVGEISAENSGRVVLDSIIGGKRIIDMLTGEMLPRIC